VESRDAVRIDAAEVGRLQHRGGGPRVLFGDTEMSEHAERKIEELLGREDRCLGHRG